MKVVRVQQCVLMLCLVAGGCRDSEPAVRMNWDGLWDKYHAVGYEGMEPPELLWLNTRAFIDSVNNGGVVSFFYNSGADHYSDTIVALSELKATVAVEKLRAVGDLFGSKVPSDLGGRNDIINSWDNQGREAKVCDSSDSELYDYFPELEKLLEAYLISHDFDPDYGF
ncbi:hypothetical protein Pla123a_21640 [Posidoniimonas polymericola]|uniref:DNA mimic protein DMP19 C-terminal domain-containing protein n=1 Tax=Posidoniimonas polymericola TaxID=2528002 RepID=A0A5C5YRP9_9BACT|nr:DUF4375 domain-containing protein [Posidoniimonas polymericola]TWT77503.1 hypothetical protein Pla123a_21640 [Posidoniimonas polymericola]